MASMKLPPGFRFHPTDIELVTYYLKRKVHGLEMEFDIIAEVDIYKYEPWDLPEKSLLGGRDPEWYFFSARDKKYANGSRTNRATETGYWKATGKDRTVKTGSQIVGMKKTLVFYKGRAPHGERTNWVMHEYRLEHDDSGRDKLQDAFVLCRVFKKNGIGPNHPENTTCVDFEEETNGITAEDIPVSGEKSHMSQSSVVPVSTKDFDPYEKTINGAPSITFTTSEEMDNDMSLFYDSLLHDPKQCLDNFTTIEGSTELESLGTVLETEMPAQDSTHWWPIPLRELNGGDSLSGNQFSKFLEYYSPEEADMLDELYCSTLQSQELNVATQHVGQTTIKSKCEMQACLFPKPVSENVYHIPEVQYRGFKDVLSSFSEQSVSEEVQTSSLNPISNLQDISEEEMLEELFQLVNQSKEEGQQSWLEGTGSKGEGTTYNVEDDVFFDILQDPYAEEWMENNLWNQGSTSYDRNNSSLESTSSQLEDWLNETLGSSSDLPFSETLPEISGSGLPMQPLYRSCDGQGQKHFENGTKFSPIPLIDSTSSSNVQMYSLQNNSSKPSTLLSRFSRLLDSVPVLPASAAEFPLQIADRKLKNDLIGNSGRVRISTPTSYCSAAFGVITFRYGIEFIFGASNKPRCKPQLLKAEDRSVSSLNTSFDGMTLTETPGRLCNLSRHGNGCFSLMFFVGAFSAVFWFLLLCLAWRCGSHVGSVLT